MLTFSTPDEMDTRVHRFCKELEAAELGEECVNAETTAINLSHELRLEDAMFVSRNSKNKCNRSTTSDEVQQSKTRKENIGNSSDNIVNNRMIAEDNVSNVAGVIERMKDMDKN